MNTVSSSEESDMKRESSDCAAGCTSGCLRCTKKSTTTLCSLQKTDQAQQTTTGRSFSPLTNGHALLGSAFLSSVEARGPLGSETPMSRTPRPSPSPFASQDKVATPPPPAIFGQKSTLAASSRLSAPKTTTMSQPPTGILCRADEAPEYGNTTITIRVGAEEHAQSFSIHEALARRESGFIDAIYRGEWKEKEDRIVRLPEHDAEHLQIFFNFIYAHRIFSTRTEDVVFGKPENDKEWVRLAKAYALGSYLQAPDFKDAITDAIIAKVAKAGTTAPQMMHQIIYPNSSPGSAIRRLLVDVAIYRWPTEFLETQQKQMEAGWLDFFCELAVAMHQARSAEKGKDGAPAFESDTCAYHEHTGTASFGEGKGAVCYKTKYGGMFGTLRRK